jgi:alpha-tubulin suppressor-like RCC1 family protein
MKPTSCPRLFLLLALVFFTDSQGFGAGLSVSPGNSHSLVVTTDGTLLARGWNGYGAINGGSTASFNQKDSKLTTLDINVVQAAAGNNYSLYLKSDGTLWGMGANWSGNLGGNAPINGFNYITQVGSNIKSIFTNQGHSLYITNDNILWGVGSNSHGQLGNGTSDSRVNRATQIATNVLTASAGQDHTLFLKSDGTLWATGKNNNGQIGDGSTTQRNTPVFVASDVRSISAGLNTSFFIKTDGSLWGCGKNTDGQSGDGTNTQKLLPTKVATNVNSVSAGYDHTLLLNQMELFGAWAIINLVNWVMAPSLLDLRRFNSPQM